MLLLLRPLLLKVSPMLLLLLLLLLPLRMPISTIIVLLRHARYADARLDEALGYSWLQPELQG